MDKKRLGFIILFVIATLVIGYALYRVFFTQTTPIINPPTTTSTPGTGQGFPESGAGGVRVTTTPGGATLPSASNNVPTTPTGAGRAPINEAVSVTRDKVTGAIADRSGNLQFYNNEDGRFYRLRENGQLELLSDQVFYNVEEVTWSSQADESIIEYPDGSNIYYNFDTKRQVSLPKHWEDFSFAADGNQIAAKSVGFSPDNRWLVSANPDGSEVKLIEPMGENADKVTVDWSPNSQIVALSRTGAALGADRQQILLIGQNGENFRALTVEGRDMRSQWSPDGKNILYSVYSAESDFKPTLWVDAAEGDAIGTNRKLLNLNTWADKCAFASTRIVYCGVPETLRSGAGFAPTLADATPDRLYRIDIQTGIKTEIPLPEERVISNIFASEDGQTLFYTDKNTSGIFRVDI